MKPFNIELAKAGHPVCTLRGNSVRIVCYDVKDNDYPILALVQEGEIEFAKQYTIEGFYVKGKKENERNLMMATKKLEGWINIKRIDDDPVPYVEGVFESESKAKEIARIGSSCENHIVTLKIEWME